MNYLVDGQDTDRLFFRQVLNSDFDDWLEFFKDPATAQHWKSEKESLFKECERWYTDQFYRYANRKGATNALIEKASDTLIGHCGLLVQVVDGIMELEVAYSLLPTFWGKGFAIEAAQRCKLWAFAHRYYQPKKPVISVIHIQWKQVLSILN